MYIKDYDSVVSLSKGEGSGPLDPPPPPTPSRIQHYKQSFWGTKHSTAGELTGRGRRQIDIGFTFSDCTV